MTGPKVDKSSPAGDIGVSNLLKMNFLLSRPLADNLDTFLSLSLEKQSEATFHLLQKGVVFATETIWNLSIVTPSSAKLSELEKKNADLTSKLSVGQIRYEKKTSELRAMIYELKSSLAEKNGELSSSTPNLVSRKDAYFRLEHKNADIFLNYDKLLARFSAYHKFTKKSKFEDITDAYKLGYLDCTNGSAPFYAIGDKDIEMLCSNLLPIQSE
ncbi:unnamed protein product [Prunus armeniaca]